MGASFFFFLFWEIGLFYAVFGAILVALPFLIIVLFLEYFIMRYEQLEELKKHTKLLQEIVELHK